MTPINIQISIPFDSLIESVKNLNLREKRQLWEIIEEQLSQSEEKQLESDPSVSKQIADAREAYKAGDYQTLDDYMAQRGEQKR